MPIDLVILALSAPTCLLAIAVVYMARAIHHLMK
jgi:hypothetical protein